jgi:two-component system cell cycle response regulator
MEPGGTVKRQLELQKTMVRGKILVIEDNSKNRKLVRSILQFEHFEVLEAPDAEVGIEMATTHRPDLILMDIQLPGMDGLEATKIIKNTPEISDIGVVALTSFAMDGDNQKAMAAGVDGYITKPIDTRKFVDNILPFLPKSADKETLQVDNDDVHTPLLLIVDDEPMNIKLLKAKVSKNYPQIIEASNGQEALEKAHKYSPDIILLDIMMPGLDGFEVTRQLKTNPKTENIPIILITALNGHDHKVMGFEAGADEFLNKPINTYEVLTRIKSLLCVKQYQERFKAKNGHEAGEERFESIDNYLTFPNKKIHIKLYDTEESKKIQSYLFGQPFEIKILDEATKLDKILENDSPDILIIETQNQKEDIAELNTTIKQNCGKFNYQVLYVTTENDLKQIFSQIEDCVDDFLTRPFSIYELRARIKILLKKKVLLDRLNTLTAPSIQYVITDQVTGLYNFEYCMHVLKHELQRTVREHSKVAFVTMEVGEQLSVHHLPGNYAGDALLCELSELIKKSIRKLDVASLRDKNKFAFVLPEADDLKTQGFIARMIRLINQNITALSLLKQSADELFNFGYAVCPDDSDQLNELIKIADAVLENNKDNTKKDSIRVDRRRITKKKNHN